MSAKRTEMLDETKLERRLGHAVARATTPRNAAIVIATATIAITVGTGILMRFVDHENYPSIGSGLCCSASRNSITRSNDAMPDWKMFIVAASCVRGMEKLRVYWMNA